MSGLARLAGIDHSYISRLENGRQIPKRETLHKIALGLGNIEGSEEYVRLFDAAGYHNKEPLPILPEAVRALLPYFDKGVLRPEQLALLNQQLRFLEHLSRLWQMSNLVGEEIVY